MPAVPSPAASRRDGRRPRPDRAVALITGGAGFVGTNLADRLAREGRTVVVLDNLSRPGVERNLRWLRRTHGRRIRFQRGDVRDPAVWRSVLPGVEHIFHLAAQVAVTTSLEDPIVDFEVNARGTLNLLEALRSLPHPPSLVFSSTNKVYGALGDLELQRTSSRYQPANGLAGIAEGRPLDFHSPYGCSKGAADQYVLDYARSFDLPAVVFRMSCIYGPHQHGTEDQGWVAHFLLRAQAGEAITLFGDGRQVRDLLYVGDLVDAMVLAQENMEDIAGRPFNIGGGPDNTMSLLELIDLIEAMSDLRPGLRMRDWRTGDQRYYASDIRRFQAATGWKPRVGVREGVARLHRWLLRERAGGRPFSEVNGREPTPARRFAAGAP